MGQQQRYKEGLGLGKVLQTAPAQVRDAVGRVLEIGDEVLVTVPKFPMRVAACTPILEGPGVPPGLMQLTLVCRLAIAIPRDTRGEDLYFLRHQAEIGDGALKLDQPVDAGDGAAGGGADEAQE